MRAEQSIQVGNIPMGSVRRFEDLNVWKEGMRLCIRVYKELKDCSDFGLRNQMQRSAVSIPSNIAEGFDKGSNKEFVRFLRISKGSCAELRTQLYLAKELNVIEEKRCFQLLDRTRKISGMLTKLIRARLESF